MVDLNPPDASCLDLVAKLRRQAFASLIARYVNVLFSQALIVSVAVVERPCGVHAACQAFFAFECTDGSLRIFVPDPYGALTCLDPDTGLAIRPPAPDTRAGRCFCLPPQKVPEECRPLMTWLKVTRDAAGGTMLPLVILSVILNVLGLSLSLFRSQSTVRFSPRATGSCSAR